MNDADTIEKQNDGREGSLVTTANDQDQNHQMSSSVRTSEVVVETDVYCTPVTKVK